VAKIRVADYIAETLKSYGIQHVFLVTGGGAMHLNDAIGRCKGLKYVALHHEQACAMAAESYFRLTGKLAAVNVTTGPGGTNALTGVYGAYVDSLGMIVISGQVKWETLVRSTNLPLRQLGDQEVDIVEMVRPITKYAEIISDPLTIRYHLEKALYLATEGRPGPVWIDVPMNVQGAQIDPEMLKGFTPEKDSKNEETIKAQAQEVLRRLSEAKRPVIIAGGGVRISNAHDLFLKFIEKFGIPVATAWNAHDLLWNDHPLYVGRPGTIGDRPGNFAVQNADLVLILGSRLNIRQISYNWKEFARHAYKIHVDIDQAELDKPTLNTQLKIRADLKSFLSTVLSFPHKKKPEAYDEYLKWCKDRRERYPAVLPEYWKTNNSVNPYCFVEALFGNLPEDEVIVTGDGTACVTTFQAANIKKGQRLYTNSGCASMGYDLPGAIGAAFASRQRVICIAGDGSIMMNLQELQSIVTHRLPIKIFILNNQGYHSIRQTQENFFADNIVGCGTESGLGFPDFAKLATAFGIPFRRISDPSELRTGIVENISGDGPQIAEIVLDLKQPFSPKVSSKKLPDGRMVTAPLEDMAPFLSREELKENMLTPLLEET
jgi:acetolactate synthase I/II/III large subunit